MKKIILFLSVLLAFNINVFAEDDESSSEPAKKKSEACENEESRNAFFLIRTHTKEEVKQRIQETRQTIDQCETNEEGESLNKQIAQMEEMLKGAPAEGNVADKKENPKDYTYGDFGEAPKKVAVDEPAPVAAKPETPAVETTAKKEAPTKKPVVATKPVSNEGEPDVAVPTPAASATTKVAKPAANGQARNDCLNVTSRDSNEKQLAKDIVNRSCNVIANGVSAGVEATRALTDKEFYKAAGEHAMAVPGKLNQLRQKAVDAVADGMMAVDNTVTAIRSNSADDQRTISQKVVSASSSAYSYITNKETIDAMKSGAYNVATNVWNKTAGAMYRSGQVLANQRNDGETNLMAVVEYGAATYTTAAGIQTVATGVKFVAGKVGGNAGAAAPQAAVPQAAAPANTAASQAAAAPAEPLITGAKAAKAAGDQAIGQSAESITKRAPAGR